MGRHFPWRKSLILFFILNRLLHLAAEPLVSQNHNPRWKSEIKYEKRDIFSSINDYKRSQFLDLDGYDSKAIETLYKQVKKDNWDKYLKTTYSRLLPYRDFIAAEVEKQGVPYEIIYLPIVESAAYPMATSHMGATGLWQFMSNSSSAYDMKTTEWVDERRDFIKSTKGAIAKLSYNYKVTGDWLLAIAAYNCGLNRVKTVVKKSGIDDFWELSRLGLLPKETINYIPKLLLVSSLLQDKNLYNVPIKWDINEWSEVELENSIDLRLLAEKSGIPFKVLKDGNSELLYNVTPPINSSYKLKIPKEYTDSVKNALLKQDTLIEFYKYRVKSGDTLSEISYHYGLSTPSLIKYNPGVSPRTLRVGRVLIVPAIKKVEPYGSNIETKIFKNYYVVKDGDTLWGLSMKFDTTVEEIALNNGINVNNYIKKGMRLRVP